MLMLEIIPNNEELFKMGKLKDQAGFGAIEILLVVLILVIIGFGGYYVWHTQHTMTATQATTKTPVATKTTTSTPTTGVQKITPKASDTASMASAFAAHRGVSVSAVDATDTHPLVAYVATTKTYWGFAVFKPSAQDTSDTSTGYQDGAGNGIFNSSDDTKWTLVGVGTIPFPCPATIIPADVLSVWNMSYLPASQCQ